MARATDQQVQQYVNERVRPHAELFRKLRLLLADDKAAIDDVYEHVSGANAIAPTWTDQREDGPPALLTPNDVLAFNSFASNLLDIFSGTLADSNAKAAAVDAVVSNLPIVLAACVRPPQIT